MQLCDYYMQLLLQMATLRPNMSKVPIWFENCSVVSPVESFPISNLNS